MGNYEVKIPPDRTVAEVEDDLQDTGASVQRVAGGTLHVRRLSQSARLAMLGQGFSVRPMGDDVE